MKEKHFINLTNGIEYIESLQMGGFDINFVRIQSTTLERKDWAKLIQDLDHNLLMHLALGYTCWFYDCGTNRKYSKTCYLGVHIINYILKRRWSGEIPPAIRFSKNGKIRYNEDKFYDFIYNHLFVYNQSGEKSKIKTKIDYYKKFVNGDIGTISPVSMATSNDGNYVYYSNLVNNLL